MEPQYSKRCEDLIQKFKTVMRGMNNVGVANPSNASNPLGPQVCDIRRSVQSAFLHNMIQKYLSQIGVYHRRNLWRPQLHIEKELYDNTKDWANKGYLPEGYFDLASTLQHEVKPVLGMCSHIKSGMKAATGLRIRLGDCPEYLHDRISRLTNELHEDICGFIPVFEEFMRILELLCPVGSDYVWDFESFVRREDNYLTRELHRKFPTVSLQFLDSETLLKEAAQRQK